MEFGADSVSVSPRQKAEVGQAEREHPAVAARER
jgi:hypothetical protein